MTATLLLDAEDEFAAERVVLQAVTPRYLRLLAEEANVPEPPPAPAAPEEIITPAAKRRQLERATTRYLDLLSAETRADEERVRDPVCRIAVTVAHTWCISIETLLSAGHTPRVVRPRMVAMYLARTMLGRTFEHIGERLHRDHTTCISGARVIAEQMASDGLLADVVAELREEINQQHQKGTSA